MVIAEMIDLLIDKLPPKIVRLYTYYTAFGSIQQSEQCYTRSAILHIGNYSTLIADSSFSGSKRGISSKSTFFDDGAANFDSILIIKGSIKEER
uniref:Uncharacterized protein n=1 Tax=Romanomermis culicivorax TaxID=13658 RepID=A0A915KF88_ROMCU